MTERQTSAEDPSAEISLRSGSYGLVRKEFFLMVAEKQGILYFLVCQDQAGQQNPALG
jgi:hypothetical protein